MAGILLQVLQADSSNVKALFRRAQAHLAQQDFVEAELDIRAALLVSASPSSDCGSRPHTVEEQSICHMCMSACDALLATHANTLQLGMALRPVRFQVPCASAPVGILQHLL